MTKKSIKTMHQGGPAGGYFLTFIGSATYFVQQAHGLGEVIVALLKAGVWPAFFIHKVFQLIHL